MSYDIIIDQYIYILNYIKSPKVKKVCQNFSILAQPNQKERG